MSPSGHLQTSDPDRVSVRYNPEHRWFYVPKMRADEVLVFKCWASARDGRARYTAHTGFVNPKAPPDALPRESIEVRTLAFFADAA